MPLDSVTLSALTLELSRRITGAKIDKVQQPERDLVLLTLRAAEGNLRLALCGGVGNARAHVTAASFENPRKPPMFCMLLRKHLTGARVARLWQPERERILVLELDAFDELGDPVQKRLVAEMIGRGTNIILVGPDGRILDCLRRVDEEMSPLRQVLPGLLYRLPVNQTKPDFFALSPAERRAVWAVGDTSKPLDKRLLDGFSCLSPLVCRELAHRCGGAEETMPAAMDALAETVANREFVPWMVTEDGRPKDVSFMPIRQYGDAMGGEAFESFSALLDAFYTRRGKAEELRRRASGLTQAAKTARDRVKRKLALQREELTKTAERDRMKKFGELITANMYRIKKGASAVTVEDFYEDGAPAVEIPLDPFKNPQQNAAAYFREYSRAKTAETYLIRLMAENEVQLEFLESVLDEISLAEGESDLEEIRRELTDAGFLKKALQAQKTKKAKNPKPAAPLRFKSSAGMEILVGRTNAMNDLLTFGLARRTDFWLHVQKVHGSHVLISCEGREPDGTSLREAASLAAYYSKARESGKTPVDYTQARFVKRKAGALPGMVVYTDYKTLIAEPSEVLAEKLRVK